MAASSTALFVVASSKIGSVMVTGFHGSVHEGIPRDSTAGKDLGTPPEVLSRATRGDTAQHSNASESPTNPASLRVAMGTLTRVRWVLSSREEQPWVSPHSELCWSSSVPS